MTSIASPVDDRAMHPVRVDIDPALEDRNRLTTAFRFLLAIPHLILVGGPVAMFLSWTSSSPGEPHWELGGAGVLGVVAGVCALIAWFAILFTGRHPRGLWDLAAYYLHWRVRAVAYIALLRDEYPPFGDGPYPASLQLTPPDEPRDRLTVAFRLLLVIPHLIVLWFLGIGWAIATIIAWFAILFTGRHPGELHRFGRGMLRWTIRVEAYLLLLRDEYPPFALGTDSAAGA